jgi:hypothetical protein
MFQVSISVNKIQKLETINRAGVREVVINRTLIDNRPDIIYINKATNEA